MKSSLLRANSVVSLRKVCRFSCCSSGSIKWLDKMLRNLSTVPESWDYLKSLGYHADDSSDKTNNTNEFDSKKAQHFFGFRHNLNPRAGFEGDYVNDFARHSARKDAISGQNPNGVYQEYANPRNHSGREHGGFDEYNGKNDAIYGQNPNGVYQDYANPRNNSGREHGGFDVYNGRKDAIYGQNPNGVYQDYANPRNNSGREHGGFDVYNGKNDQNILRNPTEFYPGRMQGSWENRNGVYGERSQGFQQNWNIYSQSGTGNYGGGDKSVHQQNQIPSSSSVNSSYSYSNGFQQQNICMVQTQNSLNAQTQCKGSNHGGEGGTWQTPNAFDSQVQAYDQRNLNWNNTQSWQNLSTSPGRQHWTNSDDQNGRSSFQQGNVSRTNMGKSESDFLIEDLDAYCRDGKLKNAVSVILSMTSKGHVVDLPRLLRLAQLCGEAEALQEAKTVHKHFSVSVSISDINSHNLMIEMFANCGSVDDALSIFEKMAEKNSETWCTMIRCLAKNGLGEEAIDMFTRFKYEGNRPDSQVFKGVFYACSILGDINEGLLHFEAMYKDYGIIPTMEHYVSVVEMLAAPGYLDEALEFVEKMPMEPSVEVWETLMNLSRVHGDLVLGDRCAEVVEQLDATRLDKQSRAGLLPVKESDVAKEKLKKASGILDPLEIRSKVHEFRAGDTAHPANEKLYGVLKSLKVQMVEMGYVPEHRFVLHDVDPETKEEALLAHSERLAFAQGLLSSPARAPIRVIKNLRVCVDCHNALKIMAKIVGREFTMRDAKRFHHLKDGECSCNDYW
ncbi:PREDICTED: pentatricopeptide repeat-containing protein At4g32450, mitochondrial-like [Tarenaya hassleriana]|uniref:pentatricopeptide repeat-containing protein At4g32450, mitochondrial-like n=1 Tax=Tarenaya hassleriana TaxID=28532 RepID=UPI00053C2EEE|nr:PREDICTED: pentatricopeptide repeat-containing protein At4g32450, mitochondrial-like [Tarenaya hassleriana]